MHVGYFCEVNRFPDLHYLLFELPSGDLWDFSCRGNLRWFSEEI